MLDRSSRNYGLFTREEPRINRSKFQTFDREMETLHRKTPHLKLGCLLWGPIRASSVSNLFGGDCEFYVGVLWLISITGEILNKGLAGGSIWLKIDRLGLCRPGITVNRQGNGNRGALFSTEMHVKSAAGICYEEN